MALPTLSKLKFRGFALKAAAQNLIWVKDETFICYIPCKAITCNQAMCSKGIFKMCLLQTMHFCQLFI